MIELSIIIPIYNAEKYLRKCLDSVLEQTYKNFELILINDGSKDSSKDICEEYAKRDSRIIVIDKANEGVSLTRNLGIKKARGKYISFVDSDDILEKDAYEKVFGNYDENLDLLIFNYFYLKGENKSVNDSAPSSYVFEKDEIHYLKKTLLNPTFLSKTKFQSKFKGLAFPWNKIFRKSIIDENNIEFRITNKRAIYEDLLFVYEYLEKCERVKFLNESLYSYRLLDTSACNKYNDQIVEINDTLFKSLLEKNVDKDSIYVRVINNFYLSLHTYFFNKQNSKSFKEKKEEVKLVLKKDIYMKSFSNIDLKFLSNNLKIVSLLVKFKCFNLLYLYCVLIQKLKKD